MASSYVPLHLRSNYSLLTGTARIEEILTRAKELGLPAIALTDTNNLYGAIQFYKLAREVGIKPIVGAEIVHPPGKAVLLAKDLTGYANLCQIITRRMLAENFVLKEALSRFHQGLFIITEDMNLAEALSNYMDHRDIFLELATPGRRLTHWRQLRECARRLGIGTVATGDVYFLRARDHELHRALVAIRENCLLSQVDSKTAAHPDSYLASSEEMARRFKDFPQALSNTLKIAAACNLTIPMGKPIFPKYKLPSGETPYGFLYKKCLAGLEWRYNSTHQAALERLKYELSMINELGFCEYFIIVGDIVRHARRKGIPVVGRGSGASSIVAYVLGITNVDPLKFNLPFERFLNPGRPDCPDLDIDLCWRLRDEVIDYVYKTYGAEHVAMISTHNTFRRRSAFREMAKAFGISNRIVNHIARTIPYDSGVPLQEELAESLPEVSLNEATLKSVIRFAERIVGFPHHLSIHCGGIVISDRTIDSYVPLQEAAKGIAITQYEMNAIKDIGLVKIDLLGNRALSTNREAVEILKTREGLDIDADRFPDEDPETVKLIQSGRTIGCCQLESPAMRNLLVMLKPEGVHRIMQALALIRPAPASIGMKQAFVRRARGLEPAQFPHPALKEVLGDTFGIMLYEDDALLLASALAGLSREVGDRLRKAIKKSKTKEELLRVSRYFLKHAARNGVPFKVAEQVWVQMAKFNEYSFCRAHAAGYGMVAYQSAYLKAHYPTAYMVAALNNVQGIYPRRVHLWEAKRMGIEVLLPCVNHSNVEFGLEECCIRIGLSQVKGLTMRTMEAILAERNRARFRSLLNFLRRMNIGLAELESLILVGGFDFTGLIRPQLIWQARILCAKGMAHQSNTKALLQTDDAVPAPPLEEYSLEQKLAYELQILECPVSAHPVELLKKRVGRNGFASSAELSNFVEREVRLLGILDTTRDTSTKNGSTMEFMTLEDEAGVFEVALFPESYRKFRPLIRDFGPYIVEGKVTSAYDAISVIAKRVARAEALQ